jgi:hypothetical protein
MMTFGEWTSGDVGRLATHVGGEYGGETGRRRADPLA